MSISVFNGLGGVILVCLPRLREILGVNSGLVKPKIIRLVFVPFLLSNDWLAQFHDNVNVLREMCVHINRFDGVMISVSASTVEESVSK